MAKANRQGTEAEQMTVAYASIRKRNYMILYLVTGAVFLVLAIRSLLMNDFDVGALLDDLFGNMMGAIPALLLFDIFYQKLNEENDAAESTKRFTDAIMSNPDNMALFKEDQRKAFLRSNISSFHDDQDVREMLACRMEPYLDGASAKAYSAIRTRFNYDITLSDTPTSEVGLLREGSSGNYYYMQQKLSYKIKYMSWAQNREIGEVFYVSFPFGNKNVDESLRKVQRAREQENAEPKVIFTESLDLAQVDIDMLVDLYGDENDVEGSRLFLERFKAATHLSVKVNSESATIEEARIDENGILVICRRAQELNRIAEGTSEEDFVVYDIRVVFGIPRLWGYPLAIFMMDPTKAPKISVSYPPETMDVDMSAYLTTGEESAIKNVYEQENGLYDVSISSEWMYPVAGMVFAVNRKDQDNA